MVAGQLLHSSNWSQPAARAAFARLTNSTRRRRIQRIAEIAPRTPTARAIPLATGGGNRHSTSSTHGYTTWEGSTASSPIQQMPERSGLPATTPRNCARPAARPDAASTPPGRYACHRGHTPDAPASRRQTARTPLVPAREGPVADGATDASVKVQHGKSEIHPHRLRSAAISHPRRLAACRAVDGECWYTLA